MKQIEPDWDLSPRDRGRPSHQPDNSQTQETNVYDNFISDFIYYLNLINLKVLLGEISKAVFQMNQLISFSNDLWDQILWRELWRFWELQKTRIIFG